MSLNGLICRACLHDCGENKDDQNTNFKSFKPIFTELTLLHVSEDDSLPQYLCTICADQLKQFKTFKDTCINSDLRLRSKFTKIKEEIVDHIFLKVEPLSLSENECENDNSDFDSKDRNLEEVQKTTKRKSENIRNGILKTQEKRKIKSEARGSAEDFQNDKIKRRRTDQPKDIMLICAKCGTKCKSKLSMKRHLETHLGPPPKVNCWKLNFRCTHPGCRITFKKKDDFEGHVQCHEKGIPLSVCDICLKPLSTERAKHRHRREKHGNLTYKCNFCTKVLTNHESYQEHVKRHINPPANDFMCDICGQSFKHRAILKTHKFTHTEERNFKCDQCPKVYKTIQSLLGHKSMTHSKITCACIVCGQQFREKRSLLKHCRMNHTVYSTTETLMFTCKICYGKFKTQATLRSHEKLHTGERPYACTICPQTFAHSELLKRHRYTHTGERPYSCEICGKGFIKSCALKTHKKTHSKEMSSTGFPENNTPIGYPRVWT